MLTSVQSYRILLESSSVVAFLWRRFFERLQICAA